MSTYCFRRPFRLRYTDFDFKDELSLTALLGIIQESATGSADELGFGYADLKPKNYGFLIVNTYGEIFRQPTFGETVTVETWPLPPRHVFFERDYRVLGEDGQPVAAAASRWCLVDLSTFSLLTGEALGDANTNCPYNPEKSIVVPNWKVPRLQEGKEAYVRSLSPRQQHALCRPLFRLSSHAGARRPHPPKLLHLVCEAGERGERAYPLCGR